MKQEIPHKPDVVNLITAGNGRLTLDQCAAIIDASCVLSSQDAGSGFLMILECAGRKIAMFQNGFGQSVATFV